MNIFHAPSTRVTRYIPALRGGTQAWGAIATGALALGALAVGALAIGRLAVGRARIRRLEIDELVVRKLQVIEQLDGPAGASGADEVQERTTPDAGVVPPAI
jgi:hypothetical protein